MEKVHKSIMGYSTPLMPNINDGNEKFWRKFAFFVLGTIVVLNVVDITLDILEIKEHYRLAKERKNAKNTEA